MDWLTQPFELAFQQRALIGGALAAVTLALVGTWVVIRGMSFLGDALVHGVLPGIALAVLLGFNQFVGAALAAVVMMVGINLVHRQATFSEDTGIGLLFVGMLGLGVIIISRTDSYSGSLTGILFGDLLGVTGGDIGLLVGVTALTVLVSVLLYRPFLVLAFNEQKASVLGLRPRLAHFALLGLITLGIIASFPAVGTMLVFGLLVGPPATAALVVKRVPFIMLTAALIGIGSVAAGLVVSYHADTSGSATVAVIPVVLFFAVLTFRSVTARRHPVQDVTGERVAPVMPGDMRRPTTREIEPAGGSLPEMPSVPYALYLQDAHPLGEAIEHVRYAEQRGFEAVWQADSRLVREATVPMAAFAATTERIKIGSGVVDIWTRNPARLASLFATLDDLAPGRVLAGLGAWWEPLATKVGVSRVRPLAAMREVVTVLRSLLANETVTFAGEFVHLDGVELDYVHQERRPKDVPIYIGATGMQMMELTGEIADGVVLNYLVSPEYNQRAMEHLAIGAARAGRSVDDLDRPQLVVCSVDEERTAALDGARLLVTQYLGQQPHIMKASGVSTDLLDEIGRVLTWPATHDQIVAASRLVPDDVVQMICAAGTPDEVRAKVDQYVATGCTCPILYPLGPDVRLMIDTFS